MIINDLFNNKKTAVAEGEVKQFLKKHRGDLEDTHSCVKCGGDLQGGTYMGHKVKVCIPCKQVYLPPNTSIDQRGNKVDEQGVAEASLGDYRKKATLDKALAQTDRFFGRDDPAKVAAADQTIAKRERGLARADARIKPYTPPKFDAEKYQRDLTAKYPNIDELVRKAELNRDPNYEYADGQAYYAARDAEQNYQKLRQIQRVIQGLNESLDRSHLP